VKKFINRPENVVEEMLDGLVALYPGLRRLKGHAVLVRADIESARGNRVALVSGGGSGHEPAHAGYVGKGMLSAAVAGEVFTSPNPDSILAAIRTVAGPPGVLLIVKSYTGDRLNFGLAAELARAEGIAVETVIVADDVALPESATHAGRRGLAGTILVHKVAGAAAEAGLALPEVAAAARAAAGEVRTMGVALSACTVPVAGKPSFSLADDEMELGLGIHGEPGVQRERLLPADRIAETLLERIVADARLERGERVALLVNNLGATPTMELAIVARRAISFLEERGIEVARAYAGTFLSALEMAGVSLSAVRVDAERLERLDAPTEAPAWPNACPRLRAASTAIEPPAGPSKKTHETEAVSASPLLRSAIERGFRAASSALLDAEHRLNALDQAVGDGDIGTSLARGVKAAGETLMAQDSASLGPAGLLHAIGVSLQRGMGGTSGPLYAVFFVRAADRLRAGSPMDAACWADAFEAGCAGIAALGGAQPGDRTMLDALVPASEALRASLKAGQSPAWALAAAAYAATEGSRATARMVPRRGRASYLGERALGQRDPGAEAVAIWLEALSRSARSS
jgi:triose/dihydroxyacetone kinase / FAD-AMP lyase (cyclizing)